MAKAFIAEGHTVTLGTRDTAKENVVKFKAQNKEISVGNFAERAAFTDVIVLAVAGGVATEAIDLAGKEN